MILKVLILYCVLSAVALFHGFFGDHKVGVKVRGQELTGTFTLD